MFLFEGLTHFVPDTGDLKRDVTGEKHAVCSVRAAEETGRLL